MKAQPDFLMFELNAELPCLMTVPVGLLGTPPDELPPPPDAEPDGVT